MLVVVFFYAIDIAIARSRCQTVGRAPLLVIARTLRLQRLQIGIEAIKALIPKPESASLGPVSVDLPRRYSHSIVPGGFDVTS